MDQMTPRTGSGAGPDIPAPQATEAVWLLVETLERLEARIHRDLHTEAADVAPPADPVWAATLSDFSLFADECMGALADPRVRSVLAAAALQPGAR